MLDCLDGGRPSRRRTLGFLDVEMSKLVHEIKLKPIKQLFKSYVGHLIEFKRGTNAKYSIIEFATNRSLKEIACIQNNNNVVETECIWKRPQSIVYLCSMRPCMGKYIHATRMQKMETKTNWIQSASFFFIFHSRKTFPSFSFPSVPFKHQPQT